ncbi:glucan ABC transporter ATP-binding protein/ permease [Pararhizobium haloflavum]|uniref:glucan ABC transporter ATP-binding protein/ permease n=1 Tax=Pararhizobium haloflavum TaxID=2037914 RepID=UPI000C1748C0|nr:glucan ABC transporter ATP-binding protein/ permease [Pararhizobium haloflavum]
MTLTEIYWRALRYLGTERTGVLFVCAANVVLAVVTIAEPILFGRVIDAIAERSGITSTLGLWAALGIFNIVSFVIVARSADRLAHRRRVQVLSDSFERVIRMPLSWHHDKGTSNALHTMLRAVEALFGLWLEFMRQHLTTAVALVLLIPTALAMDLRLTMVLVVLGVLYFMIGRFVMKRTKEGQSAVERYHHDVFGHVSDCISNVSVLQSYNRMDSEVRQLRIHTTRLLGAQFPVLDWWALASGLHRMASTISMIVVLLIGALLVSSGQLRVGDVVAFVGFANLLISRLDQVMQFVNQIFEARAKLVDFYALEDAVDQRDEPAGLIDVGRVKGHVRFENVTFQFPNSGHGVRDLSFDIPAGKTVAIVGPTGAGKTTLINMLQRVNDPHQGRIMIDGTDISTLTRKSLRDNIATVFQDAGLLNRSIEENIRLGRTEAADADVTSAASAAAADEFIRSKSSGYDTVVGERGGQLSGGERQRIAIARAVLKDAPILVLDEATSALDVETEQRVKDAIDELRRERTTFIIAHRLTTVRDADYVMFLDHGHLIEAGSFDDLAASNGRFASLLRAGGLLTDDEVRRVSHVAIAEAA